MGRSPLHPAHLARLKRERARRQMLICVMPLCEQPVARDKDGHGIGICGGCAIDVASYIDWIDDMPALTERRLQRRFREIQAEQREAADAASRAIEPGWIYYLRIDERIKIGFSTDVRQRMRSYPPHARLLAVHPGTKTLEGHLHRDFRSALAAGREWFHPHEDVLQHIARVIDEVGEPGPRHIYKFTEGTSQVIRPRRRARVRGNRRR